MGSCSQDRGEADVLSSSSINSSIHPPRVETFTY
jgi:hypothetical protein